MDSLFLTHNELPLSENAIRGVRHFTKPGGGGKGSSIGYTPEAEALKQRFRNAMRERYFVEINRFRGQHRPCDVYGVEIALSMLEEDVLNKTWLKSGKTKAKSPYKKVDGPNKNKLLIDAVAEAIDLDDSLFFVASVVKLVSVEQATEVTVTREDPRKFGVPGRYLEAV